jgi:hypothetical protein
VCRDNGIAFGFSALKFWYAIYVRRFGGLSCLIAVSGNREQMETDGIFMKRQIADTLLRGALIAIAVILSVPSGSAAPILWTLQGVTFGDGGTGSGSFDYNADTNTYSSINITTTLGGSFSGATYLALDPGKGSSSTSLAVVPNAALANTGTPVLDLFFSSALTDAGGIVSLKDTLDEGTCSSTGCTAAIGLRAVTAGAVSTVPEPASFGLTLIGIGLLGWMRKRIVNGHRAT